MKNLKKGFTLIELLVVIAIIGILATTLAPKLREQLAKAKDAKAFALLGASRTIASTVLINKMVQEVDSEKILLSEITDQLDAKANKLFKNTNQIVIGGSKSSATSGQKYGGAVNLYITSDSAITSSSGIILSDKATAFGEDSTIIIKADTSVDGTQEYSTEGKAWNSY